MDRVSLSLQASAKTDCRRTVLIEISGLLHEKLRVQPIQGESDGVGRTGDQEAINVRQNTHLPRNVHVTVSDRTAFF